MSCLSAGLTPHVCLHTGSLNFALSSNLHFLLEIKIFENSQSILDVVKYELGGHGVEITPRCPTGRGLSAP